MKSSSELRVVESTTPCSSELLGPHVLAFVQLERQDAHPAHRQRRAQVEVRAAVAEHAHRVGAALLRSGLGIGLGLGLGLGIGLGLGLGLG